MDQPVYPPPPPPPPPAPAYQVPVPPVEPPIPWETPGRPAGEALVETVKLFATDWAQGFRRMPVTGDLSKPLLYAVIVGSIGPIVAQLTSIFIPNPLVRILQDRLGSGGGEAVSRSAVGLLGIFFVPVAIVVGLFLGAAIVHLCLTLVGGAHGSFMATVRVLCYASTGQLAQVIPVIGGLVALVLVLILEVKGLETAHRTTPGKALAAVLIPVAVCCVCAGLLLATVGAAILGMLKG
jgi:hypothetical protein